MITILINGVEIHLIHGHTAEVRSDGTLLLTIRSNGVAKPGEGMRSADTWLNLARLHELCDSQDCPLSPKRAT